jgi:hypothetical protein
VQPAVTILLHFFGPAVTSPGDLRGNVTGMRMHGYLGAATIAVLLATGCLWPATNALGWTNAPPAFAIYTLAESLDRRVTMQGTGTWSHLKHLPSLAVTTRIRFMPSAAVDRVP